MAVEWTKAGVPVFHLRNNKYMCINFVHRKHIIVNSESLHKVSTKDAGPEPAYFEPVHRFNLQKNARNPVGRIQRLHSRFYRACD